MRKLWILGLFALGFTACGGNDNTATSRNNTAVPEQVINAFYQRYPSARDVDWEMDQGLYEAEFRDDTGDEKEAYYRPDGTLVRVDD